MAIGLYPGHVDHGNRNCIRYVGAIAIEGRDREGFPLPPRIP
ncbi:MAG TPA: hypothetical protein VE134_03910 [Methanomicrobiales archaeon]|nr:hypothetical protein [Methanomicrobiales archaeon]